MIITTINLPDVKNRITELEEILKNSKIVDPALLVLQGDDDLIEEFINTQQQREELKFLKKSFKKASLKVAGLKPKNKDFAKRHLDQIEEILDYNQELWPYVMIEDLSEIKILLDQEHIETNATQEVVGI